MENLLPAFGEGDDQGSVADRVVATLEQATPEGPRTLVRLTVQQGLPGLQLHDVATGHLVAATARTTLTLRLLPAPPAPAPAPEPTEPDRSY